MRNDSWVYGNVIETFLSVNPYNIKKMEAVAWQRDQIPYT